MKVIKTGPDLLLDLVNNEKRVPIADAAKELKVSKNQIVDWADILSKNGIMGIYYPLTGDGILIKGGENLKKEIPVDEEEDAGKKTSDDLVLLMKDHNFLKFEGAVKKLGVDADTVKKWVEKLEEEDVINSETHFFGDVGLLRGKNFSGKLTELEDKIKKAKVERETEQTSE